MEDQHPLKTQKLTKTQKIVNELIQRPKKKYPQRS
jgi:hypothetical protein